MESFFEKLASFNKMLIPYANSLRTFQTTQYQDLFLFQANTFP